MPIRHDFYELLTIPEYAVNIQETTESTMRSQGRDPHDPEMLAAQRRTFCFDTHVGFCLFETERNGYHDSDFYMTVWNEEKQGPETIQFATTRGGCGAAFSSHPCATHEVKAKYEAWLINHQRVLSERAAEVERSNPTFGKKVKVVKGRKVPVGSVGEIFWRGASQFGQSRWAPLQERVGIRLLDGTKVFTTLTNVEVMK